MQLFRGFIDDFIRDNWILSTDKSFDVALQWATQKSLFSWVAWKDLNLKGTIIGLAQTRLRKKHFPAIKKAAEDTYGRFLDRGIGDKFRQYLAKKINHCPYCGKSQLFACESSFSFDLDHFLPISRYPQYAISLYNLIPSCKFCNSIVKHNTLDPVKEANNGRSIFHPYFWRFRLDTNGEYSFEEIDFDSRIGFGRVNFSLGKWSWLNLDPIASNHIVKFKLNAIYESVDTKNDIFHLYHQYTNAKAYAMSSSKKADVFFIDQVRHFCPEDEKSILKYTNGKMRKDIREFCISKF